MLFKEKNPPRLFEVGNAKKFNLRDCGLMKLENDEQITFITNSGSEYDVAKKNWGFYATPSINKRLKNNNFETFIVVNKFKDFFIMIVYKNKKKIFLDYLRKNQLKKIPWPKILK